LPLGQVFQTVERSIGKMDIEATGRPKRRDSAWFPDVRPIGQYVKVQNYGHIILFGKFLKLWVIGWSKRGLLVEEMHFFCSF